MEILTKDNFEETVLNGVCLVDFYGETCEPCKALMPKLEELETKYLEKMKFYKLDTGQSRRLAIKVKVLGLPTVAIFKDGEKVEEVSKDDATVENIESMIQKYL